MLKLKIFAPCERVIVGEDGLTSMIALLERVNADLREDIPEDAVIPMRWSILTLWHRDAELENPITYQQRLEIIKPDGNQAGSMIVDFLVNNEFENFRNVMNVDKFPIGIPGKCFLKTFLREIGDENQWHEIAEYSIQVIHNRIAASV
ncbi:MAG: hypothetical protein HY231_05065 [Acidobacteria bacterium]|nr:hypothetical protein [Acidobacteriota bacterium]